MKQSFFATADSVVNKKSDPKHFKRGKTQRETKETENYKVFSTRNTVGILASKPVKKT
jgi:hypothetical protein